MECVYVDGENCVQLDNNDRRRHSKVV